MKDLAHHLKKLNRQIIRSAHREEMEEEAFEEQEPLPSLPKKQIVKELKRRVGRETRKVRAKKASPAKAPKIKTQEERSPYAKKQTVSELKKQAKRAVRKVRAERTPTPKLAEERNKEMKHRVPVFDRINNRKPKSGARTTKKKTPRI